jgi:hypothetical protein
MVGNHNPGITPGLFHSGEGVVSQEIIKGINFSEKNHYAT